MNSTTNNTPKQYASLVALLDAHRIPQDDKTTTQTHTGYGNEDTALDGRFHVPITQRKQLHVLLSEAIHVQKQSVTIVERPDVVGPIRIDLDIKYTTTHNTMLCCVM